MESKNKASAAVQTCETRPGKVETSWGSMVWLAGQPIGNATGLTLGHVTIKPGEANPRHRHNKCEEVLYLMAGKLRHTLGDESVILNAGDTITIPAGIFHNAISIGEVDADMIVAFSSAERDFELEEGAG